MESLELAKCEHCGEYFQRSTTERWKRLCLGCFISMKRKEKEQTTGKDKELMGTFYEHLPALLRLCHPDKHQNSPTANRITKWLLAMRKQAT